MELVELEQVLFSARPSPRMRPHGAAAARLNTGQFQKNAPQKSCVYLMGHVLVNGQNRAFFMLLFPVSLLKWNIFYSFYFKIILPCFWCSFLCTTHLNIVEFQFLEYLFCLFNLKISFSILFWSLKGEKCVISAFDASYRIRTSGSMTFCTSGSLWTIGRTPPRLQCPKSWGLPRKVDYYGKERKYQKKIHSRYKM